MDWSFGAILDQPNPDVSILTPNSLKNLCLPSQDLFLSNILLYNLIELSQVVNLKWAQMPHWKKIQK